MTPLAPWPDFLKPPAKPRKAQSPTRHAIPDRYVAAALNGELERVSSAPEGTRNDQLFRSAARLGEFAAAGKLSEGDVHAALMSATTLPETEAAGTIASGLRHGLQKPATVPERATAWAPEAPPAPTDADAPPQLSLIHGGGQAGMPFNVVPFLSKSLGSACRILRDQPLRELSGLRGLLEFNELTERVEVNREPVAEIDIQRWREAVEIHIRGTDANKKQKLIQLGADTGREAFAIVAHEAPYHPVQEYLRSLKPTKPVIAELGRRAFHQTTPLAVSLLRMFFVGAVARALKPGCKHDHFLVLIGDEACNKSQAVKALFDPWMSDSELDLNDPKRALSMLNRFWGHEIAELKSFKGKQGHAVKQFLSSSVDNFIPFGGGKGSVEVSRPRSCVFVGTSNDRNPHTDPTGNRRTHPLFIPKPIDIGMLRELRDAAWAEAVTYFNDGEPWWPNADEADQLARVNEDLMIEDPWIAEVEAQLTGSSTTLRELLAHFKLDIADDVGGRHAAHLSTILRRVGWEVDANATRENGTRARRWRPRHGVSGHQCASQCAKNAQ